MTTIFNKYKHYNEDSKNGVRGDHERVQCVVLSYKKILTHGEVKS